MTDQDKIVAAIDRNTTAVRKHAQRTERNELFRFPVLVTIATSLIMMACCPPAKASPVTHAPIAEQPMQYWHTQWVPGDGGVYPMGVYAPVLPRVEPELYVFVSVGDPPRLETPEPGTWWLVGSAVILLVVSGYPMRLYIKSEKRALNLRLALIDIEHSTNILQSREIARKALEESK